MFRWFRTGPLIPYLFKRSKPLPPEEQKLIRLDKVSEGSKRRPIKDAVIVHPWYSLMRIRNVLILVTGMVCFMFSGGISDFFRAGVRGHKMEKERLKFLKQLDEEDRIYEMKIAAAIKARKSKEN